MKAEKQFTRYSDLEWASIKSRVKNVCAGDPDEVRVEHRPGAGNYVGLRDELEWTGREHCQRPPRERTRHEQLRFLKGKRKHVAACRRQLVDSGDLPELERKQLADALTEVDRLYARQIEDRGGDWELQVGDGRDSGLSSLNAAKPHLNTYFERLLDIWCALGGPRMNTKPTRAFIRAAAEPVFGPMSDAAISKRLAGGRITPKRTR
jgi:hypothetical protein